VSFMQLAVPSRRSAAMAYRGRRFEKLSKGLRRQCRGTIKFEQAFGGAAGVLSLTVSFMH